MRIPLLFEVLGAEPMDAMHELRSTATAPGTLTHVVLRYSSQIPVPVTVAPLQSTQDGSTYDAAQLLFGVLPPGDDVTALIALYSSPHWTPWTRGAAVIVHAMNDDTVVHETSPGEESLETVLPRAIRDHIGTSTLLDMTSPNVVVGKHIVGVPVIVLFALLAFIVGLLLWRRRGFSLAMAVALGAGIILSDASFAARLVQGAIEDEAAWRSRRTYREAGDVYAIVDVLQKRIAQGERPRIVACGNTKQIVEYLLSPYPLVSVHEADTAVVEAAWRTARGSYVCGGDEVWAVTEERFADTAAILHLTPPLEQ
jgi:hypothetical protein